MSKQWQIRRGTTAENDSFTGAEGELTMDTDKKTLRIHDGTTEGGFALGLPAIAPDYANAVIIQAGTTEQSYTCPSYGFVVVDLAGFNGTYCYLTINGVTMFKKTTNGSGSLLGATGQYMVSPGDVCVFKDGYANAEGFAGTCKFIFIPCKGV